ncbi:hypothetical protein B0H21DRAFT_835593 [Amylocystis lapponica]|nr:hypothetical protein B0H21DRAFT_835593 [Amylocystis lapponica]
MSTTTAGESQNSRTFSPRPLGSTSVPSHLIWEEPQASPQPAPVRQENEEEKKVELRKLYTDLTWLEENPLGRITAAQRTQRAREVGDGVHGQSGSPIVGMIILPSFCTRHGHTGLSLSLLSMSSFLPFSAPAFALDLTDLFTAEYLEEDEGQRKHNEEYWGLFVPDEPSSVPASSRPLSAAPLSSPSDHPLVVHRPPTRSPTRTLSEETVLALVALVLPVAMPHREDTRANEIPPVDVAASGPPPTAPLPSAKAQGKKRARDDDDDGEQPAKRQATSSREEALATGTRAPATSAPAPTASLPSANAQGKKRAHDDDGGEQPVERQSAPSREEAPATQAAAASTVLTATKPERRGAHAGYEDPILVSEPAQTCACPLEGCEDSFAANKKAANAHLRQSHDLKGMAVDSQGRVSCPCKIEGDAVCIAKISRGDFGRHLVEQHIAKEDMKHIAADAKGRVFCLCKVEGGVVCNAKISRGEYCGHLVERHIPKEELMIWKCPREGCTYQRAARKSSAERHVRACYDKARKKAEGH